MICKEESIIAFKTAGGHRIAATKLHGGKVAFVDIDRNLQYITTITTTEERATQEFVMHCYDNNLTEHLSSALSYPDDLKEAAQNG